MTHVLFMHTDTIPPPVIHQWKVLVKPKFWVIVTQRFEHCLLVVAFATAVLDTLAHQASSIISPRSDFLKGKPC